MIPSLRETIRTACASPNNIAEQTREKCNMKKILKMAARIPYVLLLAPIYLVIYLYERLLNHLWPDPYDCEDYSNLSEDEDEPWIERWTSNYDSPIDNEDDDIK